jgi:hypothetical protein
MLRRYEAVDEKVASEVRLDACHALSLSETFLTHVSEHRKHQLLPERAAASDGSLATLGRLLVSLMSAYELGAISRLELAERLDATLTVMENLLPYELPGPFGNASLSEDARRHALNSYNGNLAAPLHTLKRRCLRVPCQPLFDGHVVAGVNDTFLLMKKEFLSIPIASIPREAEVMLGQMREEMIRSMTFVRLAAHEEAPRTIAEWRRFLNMLCQRAAIIEFMLNSFCQRYSTIKVDRLCFWTNYLVRQVQELDRELYVFAPWISVRTAYMAPTIRSQSETAFAQWNCIVDGLDQISTISDAPERLSGLLGELKNLYQQLDQPLFPDTVERERVIKGCRDLICGIQDGLQAANDALARYAGLANRCQAQVDATDFRSLDDREYSLA